MKAAILGMLGVMLLAPTVSQAGEFVGLDPYNRPVFAPSINGPSQPVAITGPHFQHKSGWIGGPSVVGPLFFAEPLSGTTGLYRADPALQAGSVIAFDIDNAIALAAPGAPSSHVGAARGPAPFTGEWIRYCEARYRSFDREKKNDI